MIKNVIKWFFLVCVGLIAMLMLGLGIALRSGTPSAIPIVKFHYSEAIDTYLCSSQEKARILPSWHAELASTLPLLSQEWQATGPRLLAETSKIIGKPFAHSEFDIPVFLCPNIPGIGFPLMVPVRMFLKSAVINKPWNKTDFVDIVYHELLHVYVARALHWNLWTPLLKKYSNESLNTKIHLHLFAVQKAVYLQLGMRRRWQFVIELNKQFSPEYSRAIQIVEKEGYQAFIDELKQSK